MDRRKAGVREWVGLAVLALPTLLISVDVSVMVLALPHVGADLGADSAQLLWIMDIYGFMLAGFMITMGTLGDRIGRRRLLMIGAAGFGLASALAAFSASAGALIASRALLGIAGATISPSILALITNMFRDAGQRGLAISIWLVCFMGGMSVGPLVGGVMLEHFWWGAVFLLGIPVMLLLLATAPLLLPEYRDPRGERLDPVSVGLSLAAILPVIYGLKEIAKHGLEAGLVAAILVGLCVGAAFVVRQRRLADPLLDLRLFGNRAFSAAVAGMFGITMTGAIMLFSSQYLQLVLGMPPLQAGLWTLPGVVAMVIVLLASPRIAARIRPAPFIAVSLLVAAAGAALLTQVDAVSGLAGMVVGFVLFNSGCAPLVTLGSGIVVGSVAPQKAGSAAALSETSAEFGFALGIAGLGSIGTAIFRGAMAEAIPAELPAAAAAAASDTLAGAVAVAGTLPGELGAVLLGAAHQAFLGSMHVVAGICATILLVVAALTFTMFRHLAPLGAPTGEAEEERAGSKAATGRGVAEAVRDIG